MFSKMNRKLVQHGYLLPPPPPIERETKMLHPFTKSKMASSSSSVGFYILTVLSEVNAVTANLVVSRWCLNVCLTN